MHRSITFAVAAIGSLLGTLATPARAEKIVMRGEMFEVWPAESLIARGLEVRTVPQHENAAWVYLRAMDEYESVPPELSDAFDAATSGPWPADNPALAEFITSAGNVEAIRLFREASVMPHCQMPYFGDSTQSLMGVLLPGMGNLRVLAKIVVVDGRRLEAAGRTREAMENYLAIMRSGRHAAEGVTMIEGLVGMAVWTLGTDALIGVIEHGSADAETLSWLARQFDGAGRPPSMERGLEGEQAIGAAVVDELCARLLRIPRNFSVVGSGNFMDGSFPPMGFANADGWVRLELRLGQLVAPDRAIKRHMREFYEKEQRRVSGVLSRPAGPRDDLEDDSHLAPRWDVVSGMMLPALSRTQTIAAKTIARAAALRAVHRIRTFADSHPGEFPDSLDELFTAEELPLVADPFSAGSLVYRRTAAGWILYSVGPNGVDDGGRKGEKWDQYDIVDEYIPALLGQRDGVSR